MNNRQNQMNNVILGWVIKAEKRSAKDCRCKECSYPSCHDPVWNESFCQYHYNEEHYLSR